MECEGEAKAHLFFIKKLKNSLGISFVICLNNTIKIDS